MFNGKSRAHQNLGPAIERNYIFVSSDFYEPDFPISLDPANRVPQTLMVGTLLLTKLRENDGIARLDSSDQATWEAAVREMAASLGAAAAGAPHLSGPSDK